MIKSIYTAAGGMVVQQKRQESVANNLANAQTPSFKLQEVIASARGQQAIISEADGSTVEVGTMPTGIQIDEVSTDYTQGLIVDSDKATDYAIEGSGFFNISYGGGTAFTRNGSLSVDAAGYLANSQGYRLIGRNEKTGSIEEIRISGEEFSIDPDGTVIDGGKETYMLTMSDFLDYADLDNLGNGVYVNAPRDGLNKEVMADDFRLVRGASERSNVDALDEMVKMIEISRAYESNQRVVQSVDEILSKAANEIGKL